MIWQIFKHLKFPVFRQREHSNCGVESLRMVLAYHKLPHEKLLVSSKFEMDEFGTNFLAIQNAAEQLGLDCVAAKVSLSDVTQLPLPLIIHWNHDHFVVVYEIKSNMVLVGDPATGLDQISIQDFAKACFNGDNLQVPKANVLIFEKSNNIPKEVKTVSSKFDSVDYKQSITAIIGAVALAFILLNFYNLNFKEFGIEILNIFSVTAIALFVMSLWFNWFFSLKSETTINEFCFDEILNSNESKLSMNNQIIEFLDEYYLNQFLKRNAKYFWLCTTISIGLGILIFFISPWFGFTAITIFFCFFLVQWYYFIYSENQRALKQAGTSSVQQELYNILIKSAEYLKVGKPHDNELSILSLSKTSGDERVKKPAWLFSLMLLGSFISLFMLYNYRQIDSSQLLWLAVSFVLIIMMEEQIIGYLWNHHKWLKESLLRSSKSTSIKQVYRQIDRNDFVADLLIEDVYFKYPSGNFDGELKGINAAINYKNKIAIVGRQGSGKSSIFKLILNKINPNKGAISFGGIPMSEIDPDFIRDSIGICSEESELLAGSVAWNITLEEKITNSGRLKEVIDATMLNRFVLGLEKGLETYIDPGREYISDGLKRKILLARLLYQNKSIFLIDLEDRYVDMIENLTLYESLLQYCKDNTVIFSTNNIEMIELADKVLMLENGEQVLFRNKTEFISENKAFLKK